MLTIKNLMVSFGELVALFIRKFELKDKELRVIIGPNGAGKSTMMDILCGKTPPNEGSAVFNGVELIGKSELEIAELGVGRKFQKPSIFDGLTVYDNLLLGLKCKKDIFHSLFFKLSPKQKDYLMYTAERVGLINNLNTLAGALSHGQKQWLEIAIVLLQDPKLLLIDEPAAGMSDSETAKTGDLLIELGKERGVIVIEHDMHFVEQIAQEKVSVLVRGEILKEGPFQEIKADPDVIACYLGSPDSAQMRNMHIK